jgi:hypothetical protein
LETDFGLLEKEDVSAVLAVVAIDDDDDSEVTVFEKEVSSDRSIPSMELDEDVVADEAAPELARFIRNDLQSPNESSSMYSSSSSLSLLLAPMM